MHGNGDIEACKGRFGGRTAAVSNVQFMGMVTSSHTKCELRPTSCDAHRAMNGDGDLVMSIRIISHHVAELECRPIRVTEGTKKIGLTPGEVVEFCVRITRVNSEAAGVDNGGQRAGPAHGETL